MRDECILCDAAVLRPPSISKNHPLLCATCRVNLQKRTRTMTGIPIPPLPPSAEAFFAGLRRRVTPEVREALKVVLRALLDESEEAKEKVWRSAVKSAKKTRRSAKKKQKGPAAEPERPEKRVEVKARCMSRSPDPASHWCELSAGHRRDHQKGNFFWKRRPHEDRTGRVRRPEKSFPDCYFTGCILPIGHPGEHRSAHGLRSDGGGWKKKVKRK